MLKQNLAIFILLAMVVATAAVLSLPEATEAGAITTWSGTEYYKCTQEHDEKICVDINRPYSESYEPLWHQIFHQDHETDPVKRDKTTEDTVQSCSGCCAPW